MFLLWALSCVLVGAAGVVCGTFEVAGGGVCWIVGYHGMQRVLALKGFLGRFRSF